MRGRPGVHAWDLPDPPNPAAVDLDRYRVLLLRAAATVFQPMGVDCRHPAGLGQRRPGENVQAASSFFNKIIA